MAKSRDAADKDSLDRGQYFQLTMSAPSGQWAERVILKSRSGASDAASPTQAGGHCRFLAAAVTHILPEEIFANALWYGFISAGRYL